MNSGHVDGTLRVGECSASHPFSIIYILLFLSFFLSFFLSIYSFFILSFYFVHAPSPVSCPLVIICLIRSFQLSLCIGTRVRDIVALFVHCWCFADDIGYIDWSDQLEQLLDWTGRRDWRQRCENLSTMYTFIMNLICDNKDDDNKC